jgi:hypothetical protein
MPSTDDGRPGRSSVARDDGVVATTRPPRTTARRVARKPDRLDRIARLEQHQVGAAPGARP